MAAPTRLFKIIAADGSTIESGTDPEEVQTSLSFHQEEDTYAKTEERKGPFVIVPMATTEHADRINRTETPSMRWRDVEAKTNYRLWSLREGEYVHLDVLRRNGVTFSGPCIAVAQEGPMGGDFSERDPNDPSVWEWIENMVTRSRKTIPSLHDGMSEVEFPELKLKRLPGDRLTREQYEEGWAATRTGRHEVDSGDTAAFPDPRDDQ